MSRFGQLLGERCFTLNDQLRFSQFSGDRNSIHLNPQKARKTLAGECIVHGINVFLWALEILVSEFNEIPEHYKIKFHGQIGLDKKIYCYWSQKTKSLSILGSHDELMVSIECEGYVKDDLASDGLTVETQKQLDAPNKTKSNYLSDDTNFESVCGGEISLGQQLFCLLSKRLGSYLLYEIGVLSNIVGMQIPGNRSIFVSCNLNFRKEKNIPHYKVIGFDKRFGKVDLQYEGRNIGATMETFIRPKSLSVDTCIEIREKLVKVDVLDGRKSLILGGSRGIGAWVAKIIGCLGGNVTVSYLMGDSEATAICSDINDNTSSCSKAQRFDVNKDDFKECFNEKYEDLFYFPTPKIFGKKSSVFEQDRYQMFYGIYCTAFKRIAEDFFHNGGSNIFYPSSIAVEEDTIELQEYKKAKQLGENICRKIEQSLPLRVIVDRLERVHTDQTLNILKAPALDPFDVALKIVKKMYNL